VRATRAVEALAAEYIADSRRTDKAPRTIQGRESRINAHVLPAIGHVPVAKWRVEHSQQVLARVSGVARSTGSPATSTRAGGHARARTRNDDRSDGYP